jgi:hypothetical protein
MNGRVLAPPNLHRIERPHALKIPVRRAEYSLTENVASPFQAEPRHSRILFTPHHRFQGDLRDLPNTVSLPPIARPAFPGWSEFHDERSRLWANAAGGRATSGTARTSPHAPPERQQPIPSPRSDLARSLPPTHYLAKQPHRARPPILNRHSARANVHRR